MPQITIEDAARVMATTDSRCDLSTKSSAAISMLLRLAGAGAEALVDDEATVPLVSAGVHVANPLAGRPW